MNCPEFPDRSMPRCPDWPERAERRSPRGRGTLTVEQISAVQRIAEERDIAIRDLQVVRRWALEWANRLHRIVGAIEDPLYVHVMDQVQRCEDGLRALAGSIEETHG